MPDGGDAGEPSRNARADIGLRTVGVQQVYPMIANQREEPPHGLQHSHEIPQRTKRNPQHRNPLPLKRLRKWTGRRQSKKGRHLPAVQMAEQEQQAVFRAAELCDVVQVEDSDGRALL